MSNDNNRQDIYQRITGKIIAAIEAGAGDWSMPWQGDGEALARPVNIASGKPYRGINTLTLWLTAHEGGYRSGMWGTYRQWQEKGAQVRKGEKAALVVFWKVNGPEEENTPSEDAENEARQDRRIVARGYAVFNADQVDGWTPPEPPPSLPVPERIDRAERFFAALGATIREGGDRACYIPARDEIHLPPFAIFREAAAYYATLAHEATHWTGHKDRCNRDLKGRFGSEAYAAEELVAELGAAFLCADLGLASEPRPDHAAYVANWLKVLKADPRAIFTAAGKAQQAADWMHDRSLEQRLERAA